MVDDDTLAWNLSVEGHRSLVDTVAIVRDRKEVILTRGGILNIKLQHVKGGLWKLEPMGASTIVISKEKLDALANRLCAIWLTKKAG